MNLTAKILIGIGAVLVVGGGIGAYFYFREPSTKKSDGSKVTAIQKTTLKEKIAVIDKQLNNPALLKFLDESDALALKTEKGKLQKELSGLA